MTGTKISECSSDGTSRQKSSPIRVRKEQMRAKTVTSPVTHNRCSKTPSFLATATTAALFALFPRRAANFKPNASGPYPARGSPRI
jgi:hypothetical protein